MTLPDLVLLALVMASAPMLLAVIVYVWAQRQNRRVLAERADERLQAMLQVGKFLGALAQDESVPQGVRKGAARLARQYPAGDQLEVFARWLLADLDRTAGRRRM